MLFSLNSVQPTAHSKQPTKGLLAAATAAATTASADRYAFRALSFEAGSTPTGAGRIRVLDLKPTTERVVDEIDGSAAHVVQAQRIHVNLDPFLLERLIALFRGAVVQ